jgi:hypothetical protein
VQAEPHLPPPTVPTTEALLLLQDTYRVERAQDVATTSTLTTLFTTSVAVLTLVGTALTLDVAWWMVAFLPLVPLPLLAWGAIVTNTVIARGYYIERVERELQDAAGRHSNEFAYPIGHRLAGHVWRGPRGNLAMGTTLGSVFVIYVAIVVASAARVWSHSWPLALVVGGLYLLVHLALTADYLLAFAPVGVGDLDLATPLDDRGPKTRFYRLVTRVGRDLLEVENRLRGLPAGAAAEVVREADEEQQQHEHQPDRGGPLVDGARDGAAAGGLDHRERDVPAVER